MVKVQLTCWCSRMVKEEHQRNNMQAGSFNLWFPYHTQLMLASPISWKNSPHDFSRWLVLAFCRLHKKTLFSVPSLSTGCHLQCPPSHSVHLDLRCLLRPSGLRWTLCWVLSPVVSPVFSRIPWRSSRPVCSCRENFVPAAPTRDTTEGPCRRSGWWAVRMGCVACRRGSQSDWSTRGWWTA